MNKFIEIKDDSFIKKYKSQNNLLKHARYIPGKTKGVVIIDDNLDKLVGYILWEGDFITAFETIEEYRNKGIGRKLLDYAVSKGASKLSVNKRNKLAIDFYNRYGFKVYQDLGKMLFMKLK